ncbi:MAG: uracil-DNA glycosylase [Myxococcales bacterium]|nr:uracil-DNA glycosylase [Myxococcales bacterium]
MSSTDPSSEAEGKPDDTPPPAFKPDPPESPEPERVHFAPERARQRTEFQADRPWERYIPEEGGEPVVEGRELVVERAEGSGRGLLDTSPNDPRGYSALQSARGLEQVREILGDCERCKLHRAGRTKIVFGVGNPHAELMFVGEGPGRQEDRMGEPFVGDAGQLLTRIIERGMGLERAQVYIANIVKCRPPNNRDPMPDEVEACEPFLKAQIHQIQPKVIIALGKYAAQTLLRSRMPISRLRGKWATYEGIDLMPTFHPAYLLRNPQEKRPVWEDVQSVMKCLKDFKRRR